MSHTCDRGDGDCRACAEQHALVRTAMTSGDRLDDITRVRIWSKLEARLAEPVAKPRWNRAILVGAGGLAAAAAVAIAIVQRGGDEVLEAPAGAVLTTAIGPHARASLVGPARVEVVGEAADATTIRLRTGAMYAEFEGGAGRSLRVEAPGATVEVVGTLFAIEIGDAGTCVSVAHGRVRVTTATGVVAVGGGEAMCTDGDHRVAAIAPTTRAALARHAVVLGDREAIASIDGVATSPAAPVVPAAIAPAPAPVAPAPAAIATSSNTSADLSSAPIAPAPIAPAPIAPAPIAPAVIAPAVTAPAPIAPAPIAPSRAPRAPSITAERPRAPAEPAPAPPAPPAPPLASDPVPAPAVTTARTAADLYRVAENALAAHEVGAADRALARLLDEFPTARETELALYERARIAYQRRAWADARRQLDRLAQIPHASLAEPGQYLACRVAVMSGDASAARCLTAYRAAYPSSPHRAEALALLIQLTHAAHGCTGARALIDELVAIAPTGALATAWQARCKDAP